MATGSKKMNVLAVAVGTFILLWFADFMAVKWFGYPFLYCWADPIMSTFYSAWSEIARVIAWCALIYFLFSKKWFAAILSALAIVIIMDMGKYMAIMFKLGGSCG